MNYRIQTHNSVCVITINGDIRRDDRERLLQCAEEIRPLEFQSAILLFQQVDVIEMGVYRELTMLQQEIRQKREKLRLIGLKYTLKCVLGEKGIIRFGELIDDLKEVISK